MRFHHPRIRRTVTGLTALALLGLGLSGCSRAEPGVVAYVGDTTITQTQVDEAIAGVTQALTGSQISTQAVTSAMIHGELASMIAARDNVTITNADRDALLEGSNLAPLLQVPAAVPVAYDLADQELVARKVGDQAYLDGVRSIPVKLNPRYGVLDPEQKTIVDGQSGSLAEPVAPSPNP